jgi:LmbE family N-acetylglucosaminyl deacetylase
VPAKKNPLNLNPLQLRTLTLLQAIARLPEQSRPGEEPGSVVITALPHPHGDHFHVGDALVAARDASGLANPAVWTVLQRKGLARMLPWGDALLTPLGAGYETGLGDAILHRHAH